MRVFTLLEEEPGWIPRHELPEDLALMLYRDPAKRVSVLFPSAATEQRYSLTSNGYVGYLPLDDGHALRIMPKVPIGNVFGMLEYAYNIRRFEFLQGETNLGSIADVFERVAAVLAKRVLDRTRKGLYLGYVEYADSLRQPRGRMMALPTTLAVLSGKPVCECEFEEHTADLEDNCILAWTLYQLSHSGFQREDVRQLVRRAYRELVNKVSLGPIDSQRCINRLYHRLNQDYRPMHAMCRFFLEHTGPALEIGDPNFIPFLVHMPTLFEAFVAAWLEQHLASTFNVRTQYDVKIDPDGKLEFRIDLVLGETATDTALAVLDTKYKRPVEPDSADINQVLGYAATMGVGDAALIYPSGCTATHDHVVRAGIRFRSLRFDVSQDLEQAGQNFLDLLLQTFPATAPRWQD